MTRVNIFLLLLVLVSAMFVVRTQYESRVLYTALHRADAEARVNAFQAAALAPAGVDPQ